MAITSGPIFMAASLLNFLRLAKEPCRTCASVASSLLRTELDKWDFRTVHLMGLWHGRVSIDGRIPVESGLRSAGITSDHREFLHGGGE